tara:strand:+ start:2440 stop:2937 length:498 start_codon:yes stop_codon:yes gene_type:complete
MNQLALELPHAELLGLISKTKEIIRGDFPHSSDKLARAVKPLLGAIYREFIQTTDRTPDSPPSQKFQDAFHRLARAYQGVKQRINYGRDKNIAYDPTRYNVLLALVTIEEYLCPHQGTTSTTQSPETGGEDISPSMLIENFMKKSSEISITSQSLIPKWQRDLKA